MRIHCHLELLGQLVYRNGWQCPNNHVEGWHHFVLVEHLAFLRNRRHLVLDTDVFYLLFCASGPTFRRVLFPIRIAHGQQEIVVHQQLFNLLFSFRQQGSEFLALLIDLLSNLLNLLDLLFPIFVVHAPLGQLHHLIQAVTSHLPVGLVLHHQVRDFHLSIGIVEGKLCRQIIRDRWNGHISFWHIGLVTKFF